MRKSLLFALVMCTALLALGLPTRGGAQRRRQAKRAEVCGDPAMSCGRQNEFQPYDLQFRLPRNAVIYESEPFYAVILKSIKTDANCEAFVPEEERLRAQALFPRNKVFSDRCPEPGTLYYSNTNSDYRFMAVYAGKTRAEAAKVLAAALSKYPTANIRRMTTGFNGT